MTSITSTNLRLPDDLAAARRNANKVRAEWLVAISEGILTADDLVRAACDPDGKPLLKISLRQLVMAQPGFGPARADRILGKMHVALFGHATPTDKVTTVAHLVDPRTVGRRYVAFRDAMCDRTTPVAGFPFAALQHHEVTFEQNHLGEQDNAR